MHKMTKKDIIKLLEKIAIYLELKGENPFRISAYRKAAQALEQDERSINEIDDFSKIKGIGKGTNSLITEYIETGTSETLRQLENEIPEGLIPLLQLPGLGGKRLAVLYKELQITDGKSLKQACLTGDILKVKGFGKKTQENILAALENMNHQPERLPIAYMLPLAEKIENYLRTIPEIEEVSLAGSLRRMRETIKDIDFIIATDNQKQVRNKILNFAGIKDVIANGDTKVSITLADTYDVNVDFRLVTKDAFATTLHHFTGSKDHNVKMRQLAKARGEKINEYGVEIEATNKIKTFKSEKAFFNHFELTYIPPEMRENKGEVEAFKEKKEFITLKDIRGDLHMHTTWSDGAESVVEMVNYARSLGYEYMAITDHSKFLRVANGLNETRLRRQREEIEKINEMYPDIHVIAGVEMDILPNGELDFSNDFLQEIDFVIAAIHSSFQQSEDEIMKRLFTALDNPYVDVIAHPTGRLIGRREGYAVNIEKLIERAKETNTALEINANLHRLDLSAMIAKQAQDHGVKLMINTDAHRTSMLHDMKYGVKTANRGWIKRENIINTWEKNQLIQFLNRNKS